MAFVLDASVTACWAFQDQEHSGAGLAFLRIRTEEAIVPCLWWFEVRNILIGNERQARITQAAAAALLLELTHLRIRVDRLPNESAVLAWPGANQLSVYDSAYLELAQREGLPCSDG